MLSHRWDVEFSIIYYMWFFALIPFQIALIFLTMFAYKWSNLFADKLKINFTHAVKTHFSGSLVLNAWLLSIILPIWLNI